MPATCMLGLFNFPVGYVLNALSSKLLCDYVKSQMLQVFKNNPQFSIIIWTVLTLFLSYTCTCTFIMELCDPRSNACWDSTCCGQDLSLPSYFTCVDIQEVSGHYATGVVVNVQVSYKTPHSCAARFWVRLPVWLVDPVRHPDNRLIITDDFSRQTCW